MFRLVLRNGKWTRIYYREDVSNIPREFFKEHLAGTGYSACKVEYGPATAFDRQLSSLPSALDRMVTLDVP